MPSLGKELLTTSDAQWSNPRMPSVPRRATQLAHEVVSAAVRAGDSVVDATAGNGHDTLFLANLVGPEGLVFAMDLQAVALQATWNRLVDAGVKERVSLINQGHEHLVRFCPKGIGAAMFNLGYFPSGDHSLITNQKTTLPALEQALFLLRDGGVLTCVCYPGHPGGAEEASAVAAWATALGDSYQVSLPPDLPTDRPFLVAIKKKAA